MNFAGPILKKLYTTGSLKNEGGGVRFEIKNRLMDAQLVGVRRIAIDGNAMLLDHVKLDVDGRILTAAELDASGPVPFPLRSVVTVQTDSPAAPGNHQIAISFDTRPFGVLEFTVEDAVPDQGS
jgi:hypothetical protein